jgi:hypothetical protein
MVCERRGQPFVNWRERKGDNLSAIGELWRCVRGSARVREQAVCVFDEGVELVCVWMMPGMEEFAHS